MSKISNIFSSLFQGNSTPVTPILSTYQTQLDFLSNQYFSIPNFNFTIDSAKKIAAILICSKILAQDIGRLPIKIYVTDEKENKTLIRDDFRYLLLHNHPNSYTDSYTFWSTVEYLRNIEGNAFVRIIRDAAGFPKAFEIMTNTSIINNTIVDGELYYLVKRMDGDNDVISAADILHFKNLSTTGLMGRDPKQDLNLNLSISYKALSTIDNFYENGAIGNILVKTVIPSNGAEGYVSPKDWQANKKDFKDKYSGFTKSGEPIFLPEFTDIVPLVKSFMDAEFINTIKYNNGQVAAYYGVPPHKIGNIESSKFNNLVELQSDYITNTIAPIITMYRRELEFKLLSDEELMKGYSIEFDVNALNITDSKTRIQNYKELFGMGVLTPNQIGRLESFESYEGGDNHYVATGYMGLDKANGKPAKGNPNIPQLE
jgi:HK97 family phage portal protein